MRPSAWKPAVTARTAPLGLNSTWAGPCPAGNSTVDPGMGVRRPSALMRKPVTLGLAFGFMNGIA